MPEWWDSRDPRTFFSRVYERGAASFEGWLEGRALALAQRTAREAEGVRRLASLTTDDDILDCPSGYGRHSLYLSGLGYRLVGADLSWEFLTAAAAEARRLAASVSPRFILGYMRALPVRNAACSVVLNLMLSFGFFSSDAEDRQVLSEFARVLRAGGRLLLHGDINPVRVLAGTYGDRSERTLPDGGRLLIEESYDSVTRRVVGTWNIIEADGRSTVSDYSLRVYQIEELQSMLSESGFRLRQLFGSLDRGSEEYQTSSQEFIVLAERVP
jgi:SAM-dependent methyltransferase